MNDSVKWADLTPRERDALVAEKVMGWTLNYDRRFRSTRTNKNGTLRGMHPTPIPRYTTGIAAAWQVVEKMDADGHVFALYRGHRAERSRSVPDKWGDGPYWRCSVRHETPQVTAIADTAPEAICIAALRACGVGVET